MCTLTQLRHETHKQRDAGKNTDQQNIQPKRINLLVNTQQRNHLRQRTAQMQHYTSQCCRIRSVASDHEFVISKFNRTYRSQIHVS